MCCTQTGALILLKLQGFLTSDGRRVLSVLVYNIFSPCLFLTKLAEFSFEDVARLWPLTANMALTHVVGVGLGLLLMRVAASPPGLRRHTMLLTAVGKC